MNNGDLPPEIHDPSIPEPVFENQQEEAPSGATPLETVLDRIDPTDATALAKAAVQYGISQQDPLWCAVQAVLDARDERMGAAAAAGQAAHAAEKIEDATRGVGQIIYDQTVRAGTDLKAVLSAALEKKTLEAARTVVDVIRYSTNEGAAAIRAAGSSLPAAAAAQRDGIIQGWKIDFSSLAAQEAAQRAQRREWWWTGAALAFGLVMALAGSWVGYRLAPRAWPAASPPTAVVQFKGETEFLWENTNAFIPRACPKGRACIVLKK
jgi:hypothetical protein